MKMIVINELQEILKNHELWLIDDIGGERADLGYIDLRYAKLGYANLRNADLRGADLRGANLDGAKNINFPIACPEHGSFIGWKKAKDYIVKLEICEDAERCSSTGRKCRCSKAKVIAIEKTAGGTADIDSVASDRDNKFVYKIGETVEVLDFDKNRWNECSTGIHFFITRSEAVEC